VTILKPAGRDQRGWVDEFARGDAAHRLDRLALAFQTDGDALADLLSRFLGVVDYRLLTRDLLLQFVNVRSALAARVRRVAIRARRLPSGLLAPVAAPAANPSTRGASVAWRGRYRKLR